MTSWVQAGMRPFLAGLILCALQILAPPALRAEPGDLAGSRSNIIVILSDDEDVATHKVLTKTQRLLGDQGTTFDEFFVTYSFCCPSRATLLTGLYPHNHRVEGNDLPSGSAAKFRMTGAEAETIAVWLQDAGYHTGYFGKYFNGYDPADAIIPPGWTDWYGSDSTFHFFDYRLNENGRVVHYGTAEEDYHTDVLTRHATATIRKAAAAGAPFFLYLSPLAPHLPSTPAPRHKGRFKDVPPPMPPSYDEADVSDKPEVIRRLPLMEPRQHHDVEWIHQARLESLLAVDDMVESIVQTLAATGELDDTVIIYTSDNGYHLGQHRMPLGKTTAYEEDIRVPFVIRGPGIPKGVVRSEFALNNDLAPTLAAIAGIEPRHYVDGRSLLPLLTAGPAPAWRTGFLVERSQLETLELTGAASFEALRMPGWTYVAYHTGERELYDLANDPYQIDNAVARTDPAFVEALSIRTAALANCAAAYCRVLEDAPLPSGPAPAVARQDVTQPSLSLAVDLPGGRPDKAQPPVVPANAAPARVIPTVVPAALSGAPAGALN